MKNHEFLQLLLKDKNQGTDRTVEQQDFQIVWIKIRGSVNAEKVTGSTLKQDRYISLKKFWLRILPITYSLQTES